MKLDKAYLANVVIFLIFAVAVAEVASLRATKPHTQVAPVQWSMPARFEANGAFTLGCALWSDPAYEAFSDQNPDTGSVYVGLSGDQENGLRIVAYLDKPDTGTVMLVGQSCGVSIDWSAFDTLRNLGPRPTP